MSRVKSTINLSPARTRMRSGLAKGLRLAVEHWLTEANLHVPHDEGTLERSGQATVDTTSLRGAVSYDTPYAVRQHEDMELHHDGKGEAKWLESTGGTESKVMGQIIARAAGSEVGS